MGCSICMDDFDEADDGQRPTALPCGHIFHYSCVQSWFYGSTAAATSLPNKQRCPLCAKPTNPITMMRLYPSEGNDLNHYLKACHWTQGEDTAAALAAATTSKAKAKASSRNILDTLMNFNLALQSFVMGGHNLRVSSVTKAGVTIQKLVEDLRPEGDEKNQVELKRAMNSLTRTLAAYDGLKHDVEKELRKVSQRTLAIDNLELQAKKTMTEAENKEARANMIVEGASKKLKDAEEAQKSCRILTENLERRAAHADALDANLRSRQRALEQERKQEAFNTSTKISMVESKTREELNAMHAKLAHAEQKCRDAERQRLATKEKNNLLAEQMREMKERLKQSKTGATAVDNPNAAATPASPASTVGSAATIRKQAAEIQTLKQLVKRLESLEPMQLPHTCSKQKTKSQEKVIDLTRSRSPSPVGETISNTVTIELQSKKRPRRSTLVIEPDNLDDESDDDLFPMHGLVRAVPREPLHSADTNTTRTSTDGQLLDRISAKSGVVLGRKRRPPL